MPENTNKKKTGAEYKEMIARKIIEYHEKENQLTQGQKKLTDFEGE